MVLCATSADAQNYFPKRVPPGWLSIRPYASAGIVESEFGAGSGTVARDRRLVYSCGHVLFDNGRWSRSFAFARAYHRASNPSSADYRRLRGYRYQSSYSGSESVRGFSSDFSIGFGWVNSDFGPPVPVPSAAAGNLLGSAAAKIILGYPSYLDFNYAPGGNYQHQTGPFARPFRQSFGTFYEIFGVSTGPGNSGGPVLVRQGTGHLLAGVLVSGGSNSAGIYALDSAAVSMAREALVQAGAFPPGPTRTAVFANRQPLLLPDASTTYQRRLLGVRGQGADLRRASLTLVVRAPFRGDLDVFLRSPRGRVRWVSRHDPDASGAHLRLMNYDITGDFLGSNPNGTWSLFLRDVLKDDRAVFQHAALAIGTR